MKKLTALAVAMTMFLAPASHAGKLFLGAQWGQGSIDVDDVKFGSTGVQFSF